MNKEDIRREQAKNLRYKRRAVADGMEYHD